jgi:hypothetical protein
MPMSQQPRESPHDDLLIRYLLGSVSEEERERLDEQSIVDDELAARLGVVEDELVDAYARGRLTGDTLERFENVYVLSLSRRRGEKTAFAKRFVAAVDRTADAEGPSRETARSDHVSLRRRPWSLAAAAVLLLGTSVLVMQNVRAHRELQNAERQVAVANQRADAASSQLEEQQKAAAAARQALADAPGAQPPATVALILLPQTRGADPVPIIAVRSGSSMVPLELTTRAVGASPYNVTLRDPTTNRVVWRSPPIAPQRRRPPVVSVLVPAALLKSQHYAIDLFRLVPGAPAEFVDSYAFEVVRQ